MELIKQILKKRRIDETWFEYDESDILDPKTMLNLDKAFKRIEKAIKSGERIAISADIDPDGVTSSVSLYKALIHFGAKEENVRILRHSRGEGHGIKYQVDQIDGEDLLIICDSSTNDVFTCEELSEWMDVIILDHHEVEEKNLHVLLVNPQQRGCEYKNKHISAATVVYHLIQLFDEKYDDWFADQIVDLTMLGMIADVVDMKKKSNRAIVKKGLDNIQNVGLAEMVRKKNAFSQSLKSSDIAFNIIPAINSALRYDEQERVFDLFLEEDPAVARKISNSLFLQARKRKEALTKALDDVELLSSENVIIGLMSKEKANNSSLNGVIAQKLASEHKRPAILISETKGGYGGSLRSYSGFDLREYLLASGLFVYVSGHAQAAGVKFNEENLENILQYIKDNPITLEKVVRYDLEVDELTADMIAEISELNKVTGNKFESIKVKLNSPVRQYELFGSEKNHGRLSIDDFIAVKFFVSEGDAINEIKPGDTVEVIGEPSVNRWYHGGQKKVIIDHQILIDEVNKIELG